MWVYSRFFLGSACTGPCFMSHPGGCGVPASGCCHGHFFPWTEEWREVWYVLWRGGEKEVEGRQVGGQKWESPCFSGSSSRLDAGTSVAGQAAEWWCMPSPPSQEWLCASHLNQQFLRGWQWLPFIFGGELNMEGKQEQEPLSCITRWSLPSDRSLQGEVCAAQV